MTLTLSPEQLAIAKYVEDGRDNVMVVARAGTGKTFLIRVCLPLMRGPVAILAYNNKIAKEIESKVRADNGRADVGTFHSFGNRLLRRALPKAKLEGRNAKDEAGYYKADRIIEELKVPEYLKGFVRRAMDLGMQRGFGVVSPLNNPSMWLDLVQHYDIDSDLADDNIAVQMRGREQVIREGCQFAAKGVKLGITIAHEVFSFADMLYLPLVLNARFPQYGFVAVDEAQDSNPVRREMAARMVRPGGRMFFVGDPKQSINGWCGADNDAMDRIGDDFRCRRFAMTVTFRCAKAVVELVKPIVPDYRAAEANTQGVVRCVSEEQFYKDEAPRLVPSDAIICRNTKPLVVMAYRLLGRGVACHVEGKDIGKDLVRLVDRFPGVKSVSVLVDRLADYLSRRMDKLMRDKKEAQAEALSDRVETVLAIIEGLPKGSDVEAVRRQIASLFADSRSGEKRQTVTLLTAHKSKGLEFERVFGLGVAKLFPSRFARQPWMLEQESCLEYVLKTRAITEYVDIMVP